MSVCDVRVLFDGGIVFIDGKVVGVIDKNGKLFWIIKFVIRIVEVFFGVRINVFVLLDGYIFVVGIYILFDDLKFYFFIGVFFWDGIFIWIKVFNMGYYDYLDVVIFFGNNGFVVGVYGGGSDVLWIVDYFVLRVFFDGKIEWFNFYVCLREEDWDRFWSMKVFGVVCNDDICVFGIMIGMFVINVEGKFLMGFNFFGKVLRVENNLIFFFLNGIFLMVLLKGVECCVYLFSV